MYFISIRPQRQESFWNFVILLDSFYDSSENEAAYFVKIRGRFLDLWLPTSFDPHVFFGPQTSKSTNFLRFIILWDFSYYSGKNEFFFVKIRAKVLKFWLNTSGPKLNSFIGPRPQGQESFWNFIILLDSSYDSSQNKAVFFMKIGGRFLDLWLNTSFDSHVVFRPQNAKSTNFLRFNNFTRYALRLWKKWGPVSKN